MKAVPKVHSAAYWLWARHRSRMRSTVAAPPRATGSAGRAAPAGIADERALPPIALPDGALDLRRDGAACGRPPSPGARPGGGRELGLFELADQRIEGAVEHRGDLARGELMAQQRLGVAQLLVSA